MASFQFLDSFGITLLVVAILIALFIWIRKLLAIAKLNYPNVKDSAELENALSHWNDIVIESLETHRDVKIFKNLARVICELSETNSKKRVRNLVGLTALFTIGELKVSDLSYIKLRISNFYFFSPNLKNIEPKTKIKFMSTIQRLDRELDDTSIELFLKVSKSVEFPATSQ